MKLTYKIFKPAVFVAALLIIFSQSAFAITQVYPGQGNPRWHAQKLYSVFYRNDANGNRLKTYIWRNDGVEVAVLKAFEEYTANGEKYLRLISNHGFVLENIPMSSNYFYNECVEIFLEGEEFLPIARDWLKANGYNNKSLNGLKFKFPDDPSIGKNGYTRFQAGLLQGWVVGLAILGSTEAWVTASYDDESTIVHEYIHLCGYDSGKHPELSDHGQEVFKKGQSKKILKSFKKTASRLTRGVFYTLMHTGLVL